MYRCLEDIEFIIFDLDGVFYREDEKIDGTKEIIDFLDKKNIDYCFFTNNSNYKTDRYKNKLLKGGVDVVITSYSIHYTKLYEMQNHQVHP